MAKAEGVDSRLTRLWNNRYNGKVVGMLNVQFGFNRSELDDGAQTTLAAGRQGDAGQSRPSRSTSSAIRTRRARAITTTLLSQRRVEAVRRFLVEKGVQIGQIEVAVGLGAISDPDARGAEAPAWRPS